MASSSTTSRKLLHRRACLAESVQRRAQRYSPREDDWRRASRLALQCALVKHAFQTLAFFLSSRSSRCLVCRSCEQRTIVASRAGSGCHGWEKRQSRCCQRGDLCGACHARQQLGSRLPFDRRSRIGGGAMRTGTARGARAASGLPRVAGDRAMRRIPAVRQRRLRAHALWTTSGVQHVSAGIPALVLPTTAIEGQVGADDRGFSGDWCRSRWRTEGQEGCARGRSHRWWHSQHLRSGQAPLTALLYHRP